MEILHDNPKGVSLKRLHKMIQKRINFMIDLHKLCFRKLKILLQTIQELPIENDASNLNK